MAPMSPHLLQPMIAKLESIFSLTEEERYAVEGLPVRVQTLKAHQDIVRHGDMASQCCLILEGWASHYKILGEGRRQIFSFHIAGDMPDLQSLHIPLMDHNITTMTNATVVQRDNQDGDAYCLIRECSRRAEGLPHQNAPEASGDCRCFRRYEMDGVG
jgi:CRP-like cAMP-binding protein